MHGGNGGGLSDAVEIALFALPKVDDQLPEDRPVVRPVLTAGIARGAGQARGTGVPANGAADDPRSPWH